MKADIDTCIAPDDTALMADSIIDLGLSLEAPPELQYRPIGSPYHRRYPVESAPDDAASALATDLQRQRTRDEYKQIITCLNDFMEWALSTTEKPIVPKLLSGPILSLDLSNLAQRYIDHFPVMVEVAGKFSDQNRYDEYIELFRDTCRELGLYEEVLLRQPSFWCNLDNKPLDHTTGRCAAIFNNFVETLRRLGRETNAARRRTERLRDAKERHRDYCRYFDSLIKRFRRLEVVRVELGYQKTGFERAMSTLKRDFDVFLRSRRSHQDIFKGLVGYVVKFEYGVDRGPHIHLLLIFDGDLRQGCAKFFSQKSGEHWETITEGRGNYRNGHLYDEEYARRGTLGIGSIHINDQQKRENFCNYVLAYLCKADSFAHPKEMAGFKVIRRGELPKKSSSRKKPTAVHKAKSAKVKKRTPARSLLKKLGLDIGEGLFRDL